MCFWQKSTITLKSSSAFLNGLFHLGEGKNFHKGFCCSGNRESRTDLAALKTLSISGSKLGFKHPNLASKAMSWWAGSVLFCVHYYYFTAPVERSTGIFLSLMFTFAKVHMVSWNSYDAGLLSDPEKSKYMTEREKFYAQACV